jgi:hypothetical protein
MHERAREPGSIRRRREAERFTNFLAYLQEVERALMSRDAMRVTALLRKRTATHMPREVREELLFLSRASRENLRAPIQFLRFQHRMTELASGGERLPTAQTEMHFEPRPTTGTIRLRDLDDRRAAARGNAGSLEPRTRDSGEIDSANDAPDVEDAVE